MRKHFPRIAGTGLGLESVPADIGTAVFLGGTINDSTWREKFIPLLEVPYFNPVVKDWTAEHAQEEQQAKTHAGIQLFVITPKQHGFYSIAELMFAAAAKRDNQQVVVVFLDSDETHWFDEHQRKSNREIMGLVSNYPMTHCFGTLEDAASYINQQLKDRITLSIQATDK